MSVLVCCAGVDVRLLGGLLGRVGHRWPVLLVVPAFDAHGYAWPQTLVFSALTIALAEVVYALLRPLLDPDRPGRR